MDDQDELLNELRKEFLIESNENLTQLDQDFVEMEQRPDDYELLSSVFRTTHTLKGTCRFLGYSTLQAIAHRAESILLQLRERERILTPELTTLLLEAFDAGRTILVEIESTGADAREQYHPLRERLKHACDGSEGILEAGLDIPAEEAAADTGVPESSTAEETIVRESSTPAPAEKVDEGESMNSKSDMSAPPPKQKSSLADSNIRVKVELLDNLMNLVGELVLARNQILQFSDSQQDANVLAAS